MDQHSGPMRRALVLPIALLALSDVLAQGESTQPYTITVEGRVLGELDGEPVDASLMVVRRDGEYERSVQPRKNGRYVVELQRGHLYEIAYMAAGSVTKRVSIDTKGAPPLLDVPSLTMTVEITLFPAIEGLSTAMFKEPLGRAFYKHSVRNMVWDQEYGERKRDELRRYMAGYDKAVNGPFINGQQ
jgi:hypothetical protein